MFESIPGKVFVVGVLWLITTIAYSSQLIIFLPAYEWSFSGWLTLLPLNLFVFMIYYNYYMAVMTDPGKIPGFWEPPASLIGTIKEQASEGITGPRFCKTCNRYKPPRTHHCRYCKRCVLKMDHHCPWINNCVGHANQGHFIRFVIYVCMACSYVLALLVGRVMAIMDAIRHFQFNAEPSTLQVIFMVINFVLAFIVLFSVGILSIYQIYCMTRNQTSIEAYERGKVEKLIKRGKIAPVYYPYDISIYKNICDILGHNPLLWLWPQPVPGDGLSFSVIPGTDPRLPFFWPPRDPDDLRPSIFSSKYKRMQEARDANMEDQYQSDGYYDSGSGESGDEYSVENEEEGMNRLIDDRLYGLSGTYYEHTEHDDPDEELIPLSQLKKKAALTKQD
ncbi:zf-DHHC-domain-containing protein [Backusella circina FSU 941]|nr:zf-DHHC-domain-containing protein [Backusella circina FSU 941]